MYHGEAVEEGTGMNIFHHPRHPYTRSLLSAVPVPDPDIERNRQRIILTGDVPSPARPPLGCNFNTRCPVAVPGICYQEPDPELEEVSPGHWVACHRVMPF